MPRCLSCNVIMTDREATRKYASSGTFIDLCNHCFAHVAEDIPDIESENIANEFSQEDVDGAVWDYVQSQLGDIDAS